MIAGKLLNERNSVVGISKTDRQFDDVEHRHESVSLSGLGLLGERMSGLFEHSDEVSIFDIVHWLREICRCWGVFP